MIGEGGDGGLEEDTHTKAELTSLPFHRQDRRTSCGILYCGLYTTYRYKPPGGIEVESGAERDRLCKLLAIAVGLFGDGIEVVVRNRGSPEPPDIRASDSVTSAYRYTVR